MQLKQYLKTVAFFVVSFSLIQCDGNVENVKPIPSLEKRGEALQLMVDGQPFLVLGGELHNSSSSSLSYMRKLWPKLDSVKLNTVLAAIEWGLVEPEEGSFDFSLVDGLIRQARNHNKRLILLWFGAWKNGQSHYTPSWVKNDFKRFQLVKTQNSKSLQILTPLSQETLNADTKAFTALMKHIKEVDSNFRTVIMVQVQNEVGILGSERDFSEKGNQEFNSEVPAGLMNYLKINKEGLYPGLLQSWEGNKNRISGTWTEVFGQKSAPEYFMAWNYAKYINHMAITAKEVYNIPMFVNAWIVQPEDKKPGDYPSGGPQAHVLDFWKAAAPDIDLFCPDIYLPDFENICDLYSRNENALFIPESRAGEAGEAQCFLAIGRYNAIGYSPFGIESRVENPANDPIPYAYSILSNMAPVILEAQEKGMITSVLLKNSQHTEEVVLLGEFRIHVELLKTRGTSLLPELGYCLLVAKGKDEYFITGKNVQVSFSAMSPGPAIIGLLSVDEGKFVKGEWIPGRRLNGDAIMIDYDLASRANIDESGTGLRFTGPDRSVQHVKLYRYE